MLKKTIEFVDYDGNKRKEDFWFNLSKAEIMEMELLQDGGLEKLIQKIISTQDLPELVKLFKALILKSYGEKSPDGRRFIKSDKLTEEFTQTEAYSQLFMELATDSDAAAKFVNGIIPSDVDISDERLQAEVAAMLDEEDNA